MVINIFADALVSNGARITAGTGLMTKWFFKFTLVIKHFQCILADQESLFRIKISGVLAFKLLTPLWNCAWWNKSYFLLKQWHYAIEMLSTLLALCDGNWLPISGFLPQRPIMWSFDVTFGYKPEQVVEQTLEMPVIWDMWSHWGEHIQHWTANWWLSARKT